MALVALLAGMAVGCAGLFTRPQTLQVRIEPETIRPGDVVKITVTAPPGTQAVKGRLDVPGSPVLPLRSQENGRVWTFTTQIPLEAVWKPGRYRAVVEGRAADGGSLYGETWITAP